MSYSIPGRLFEPQASRTAASDWTGSRSSASVSAHSVALLDEGSDPSGWIRVYICIAVAIGLTIAFWYVTRSETETDDCES